jgi:hypothetical protein
VAEHAGPDAEEGHREALRATVRHESIRHTAVFTVGSSSSAITISETSPGRVLVSDVGLDEAAARKEAG